MVMIKRAGAYRRIFMSEYSEPERKKKSSEHSVQAPAQTVQRDLKDVNGPKGGMLPNDISSKIQSLRGTGQRLSDRQLQNYSQKFGRDMSDVHIHTDAQSDTISRSLNARAFTIGSDVFLTKGINPDGGGRDEQTMTHELTHVVQQNGRASYGALKLGAADTAQEHEAESTAQREFQPTQAAPEQGSDEAAQREFEPEDEQKNEAEAEAAPEIQRESIQTAAPEQENDDSVQREFEQTAAPLNTVQRGFWSNLGSSIGRGVLNGLGMGSVMEVYDEFMSGDHKVRAAINKMDDSQLEAYHAVEDQIKSLEGGRLESARKNVSLKQEALTNAASAGSDGAAPAASGIQQAQNDVQQAGSEYDELKAQYQELLNQQLKMIQAVDQTVTVHDVNKYRSGKGKALVASIFASAGGSFLAGFKSGDKAKSAARSRGMKRISNWFAASGKGSAEYEEEEEPEEAEETEAEKEAKAKEAKRKESELITAVWQDVQADDKLKSYYGSWILFKRTVAKEHSDMIQESIKDGESDADIRAAVLEALTRKAEGSMNKPTPAAPAAEKPTPGDAA